MNYKDTHHPRALRPKHSLQWMISSGSVRMKSTRTTCSTVESNAFSSCCSIKDLRMSVEPDANYGGHTWGCNRHHRLVFFLQRLRFGFHLLRVKVGFLIFSFGTLRMRWHQITMTTGIEAYMWYDLRLQSRFRPSALQRNVLQRLVSEPSPDQMGKTPNQMAQQWSIECLSVNMWMWSFSPRWSAPPFHYGLWYTAPWSYTWW